MSQLLHISDTHLGYRQYSSDIRRQDFIDAFEASVERAIESEVDAIIHTGDLFHRRTPPLPEVNQCINILQRAADESIPFYGIVGNHDRKMDDQWLDLIEQTGTASRLDRSPTMVNDDIALYGIDAVPSPAWESADFSLEPPENNDAYRLLCMHQILHPPVPEIMAEYPAESVIERLNIDIDGLALGDYHEAVSEIVNGVDVWYAGSTERGSSGEEGPRSVTLLSKFNNGSMTRQQLELDTREFQPIEISFAEDEGYAHARDKIITYDMRDAVAVISLSGKRTSLTASDVHEIALDRGASVAHIDDNRGREHFDIGETPSTEVEDADTLIDQRLSDVGLSEPALEVEELVRDEETSMNALADTANELIIEAQETAFSGEAPPESVLGDEGNDAESEQDDSQSADESQGESEDKKTEEREEAEKANADTNDSPSVGPDSSEVASLAERAANAGLGGGNEPDLAEPPSKSEASDGSGSADSESGSEARNSGNGGTTSQRSFGDFTSPEADTDPDKESDSS